MTAIHGIHVPLLYLARAERHYPNSLKTTLAMSSAYKGVMVTHLSGCSILSTGYQTTQHSTSVSHICDFEHIHKNRWLWIKSLYPW